MRWFRWIIVTALLALIPVGLTAIQGARLIWALDVTAAGHGAVVYDVEGDILTTLGKRYSPFVPFAYFPPHLVDAVVAIEDTRFWHHQGVDVIGIVRATVVNLRTGRREQGASTVTQQLARNLFLSREKSFVRKFKEAIYALLLEVRFSKRQIMELYLNRIYFGSGAYGIEEAARTYFDKSTQNLSLSESAFLIGLLKAPSALSSFDDTEPALTRRNLILERMEDLGMITPEEKQEARNASLTFSGRPTGDAPYFIAHVRAWLIERFGSDEVYNGNLRVWTTLDRRTQEAAEAALDEHQGAIVALDPRSGAITALVGGRDYTESQFNRATQALRQPGSAFKPFVFAAALERGWQMNDLVEDVPQQYGGDYAPQNFRDEYWGRVTLKHALVESLNNGAVWLLQQIGPRAAYEMAQRLGITTLTSEDRNLALALGGITRGVTPIEMAAAYLPFANGGIRFEPFAVTEVRSGQGELLYRHRPRARRVLSPEVAYFITDMLQDAVRRGTATAADIGRPQAGKTGTTNERVSAWFVGYTPEVVAAVYLGEDDGRPLSGGGGTLAAPIWGRFARRALNERSPTVFPRPDYIVDGIVVDIFTGLLANENCPYREEHSFVRGREPRSYAPCAWSWVQPDVHDPWPRDPWIENETSESAPPLLEEGVPNWEHLFTQ